MNAVLAVKPMDELTEQYGPMRTVLNSDASTDTPREQSDAYGFNILAGKGLRESIVNDADDDAAVIIRCVEYIDPVTQETRYGVDYWSISLLGHRPRIARHGGAVLRGRRTRRVRSPDPGPVPHPGAVHGRLGALLQRH